VSLVSLKPQAAIVSIGLTQIGQVAAKSASYRATPLRDRKLKEWRAHHDYCLLTVLAIYWHVAFDAAGKPGNPPPLRLAGRPASLVPRDCPSNSSTLLSGSVNCYWGGAPL
jgi:hypothetical protein